jgi:uncharacterized cupin superfamily protein
MTGSPRHGATHGVGPANESRCPIPWEWEPTVKSATMFPMNTSIVVLDGPVETEVSEPAPDRLLAGKPVTRVSNYFSDVTQQFFAGRWAASRGKWRVRYTENELCVMTAGRVVIESEAGQRNTFGAGDAFVVPAGFSGTWEVLEDCCKIYAIFESNAHKSLI